MEKIQFSVPISYPFKTDGCKDKKAIVITKCFIRYNIVFENVKSQWDKKWMIGNFTSSIYSISINGSQNTFLRF